MILGKWPPFLAGKEWGILHQVKRVLETAIKLTGNTGG